MLVDRTQGAHFTTLVTAGATCVDLDVVKSHLYVDFDDDDALIGSYIAAATFVAQEKLGKVLMTQTWEEAIAKPSGRVYLSKIPAQSLVSVKYYDADNVEQTATLSDFTLVAHEDWAYVECDSWPAVYDRPDALTIRYVAGFGAASADTPANIHQAILLLVGQYYAQRENITEGKRTEPPQAFNDLINLSAVGWYG